jgi:glycosyltransferase 2 family protein
MKRGVKLKIFIGIVSSAFFLVLALRNVSFAELLKALAQVNYLFLIPALILSFLVFWLRAIRWRYMLLPVKSVGNYQLFNITIIGFMVNNVLPLRIGELVRAHILGKRENLSKSFAFATIIIERLLDGLTILSFFIPIVLLFSFPRWLKQAGLVLLFFYIGIIIFLLLLHFFSRQLILIIGKLITPFSPRLAPRLGRMLTSFCGGLKIFKTKKQIFWICCFSYGIWIGASLVFMVFLYAFHITFPFYAPFLLLVVVATGVAIPSSPGFIGTLQISCVIGLALFGVPKSESLGFSIVYHASQYIPVTLLGFFFMWKEHLHFKEITVTPEEEVKGKA